MTKEELKQKAEKQYNTKYKEQCEHIWKGAIFTLGYLAGAEPREKQLQKKDKKIEELEKDNKELIDSCLKLHKDYGNITDRVEKLVAQIKKMQRCEICKHYKRGSCNYHSNWVKDCKKNGMKLFELKEVEEK